MAALDARSGKPQWTFTADGRVQAPPTLHRGLLYFGGQNGCVYCLRAADGQLVWKFFAARNVQRIIAGGQLESVWPVVGSPVIHKGQLVVNAGRHTTAEGGIRLYGLDPLNGAIQWQATLDSVPLSIRDDAQKGRSPYKKRDEFPMFRNTLLVSDGENLHIGQWRLPNGTPDKANFPGQSIPDAEQDYICPNQAGFLCRREYSEGGQVADTYLRQLRYSQVEGGRIAIQDNVIVTSTVEKSNSTRVGGDFVEGIRAQRINPDGTARRPIYEPVRKRGDQPLPEPVLFDLSLYELAQTDAPDAFPPNASAMAIAGQTIVLACKDQTLRLHGLRDGKPLAQIELPGVATRDGIAIFGGRIYLTLVNGKIVSVTTR
jgi:hypothetical protein